MERNYQTRRGEIDLILQEEASLVFVEVRYQASSAFGRPEETVDSKKQSRLRFTAEVFLQRYRNKISAIHQNTHMFSGPAHLSPNVQAPSNF